MPIVGIGEAIVGAPPSTYTARFGVGADNATGTGAFDTSLYTGSTPANGTYGNFTVSSGVITPNGSQTVGTYDVGGWSVEVINGYKAVANQTQFNALTPANSSGKTILIREAAALSVTTAWNDGGDFGWATILGDGPDYRSAYEDASKDSRKHFVTWSTRNTKKLILDSLNVVTGSIVGARVPAIVMNENGGGANAVRDIQVLRCRIIGSRPDANGDYSGGVASFPGGEGVTFGGSLVERISVRDNVVYGTYGATASINFASVTGWGEAVGNHVDMHYGDALRASNARILFSSNLLSRPLALASDSGNPHGDAIQFLDSTGAVVEAIGMVQGDTRGNWQNMFAGTGTNYRLFIRDCVISDESLYAYTIQGAGDLGSIGSTMENVVWLPMPGTSLPIGATALGGIRFRHTSGTNELKNSVHRASFANVDGAVTQTGVVNSTTWTTSDYNTNFPNWDYGTTIPTLANVLGTVGLGASAAAGKTPRILSSGAERSSIVLNITAPTLSSLSLTPASDGFTGTVASNQTKAPIYWCVVSNGSPAPSWRDIKERRATGAVTYGEGWVTGATLALSTSALSPSTTYAVYAVQETGWSVQSNILSASVTTAAAGISRVAVGTTVATSSATINIPIPSSGVVNGDYLVAFLSHVRGSDPTTPTDWTHIGNGVGYTGGTSEIEVYGRVRDGTEGANLTVNLSGTGQLLAFCAAWRGVSGDGAEATGLSSNTSLVTPTLTATANSCILHIFTGDRGTATVVTMPNPSDLVAEVYNGASSWYLGVENQLSVSAGVTTARTATSTQDVNWNTMQVELLKA